MPRKSRNDESGQWHHVFNRAIARRTLFERREDYRFFLACVARAVRRNEIEVHAYCLMGTHYHLLVRSPHGKLAEAMQRIQLAYSRWFNRTRRRDGSLVRGRYGSKPVRTLNYRKVLLRYIDLNPCTANIVRSPALHEWGSARHYANPSGPPWLTREWVESEVARECSTTRFQPELYDANASSLDPLEFRQLVEARMQHHDGPDPWDNIVTAATPATRQWMIRKAILADGTQPGLPILAISRLDMIIERNRALGAWLVQRGRSKRDGWAVAHIGLQRDLCGQTLQSIAETWNVSCSKVRRMYAAHRAELQECTVYSLRIAQIVDDEFTA
tara:strand:- start:55 stop:1041 length:987 start_codon:yes stop_codon:yes gene_type:complete